MCMYVNSLALMPRAKRVKRTTASKKDRRKDAGGTSGVPVPQNCESSELSAQSGAYRKQHQKRNNLVSKDDVSNVRLIAIAHPNGSDVKFSQITLKPEAYIKLAQTLYNREEAIRERQID